LVGNDWGIDFALQRIAAQSWPVADHVSRSALMDSNRIMKQVGRWYQNSGDKAHYGQCLLDALRISLKLNDEALILYDLIQCLKFHGFLHVTPRQRIAFMIAVTRIDPENAPSVMNGLVLPDNDRLNAQERADVERWKRELSPLNLDQLLSFLFE
jgi:hypothetical protein